MNKQRAKKTRALARVVCQAVADALGDKRGLYTERRLFRMQNGAGGALKGTYITTGPIRLARIFRRHKNLPFKIAGQRALSLSQEECNTVFKETIA